jgi:hypothetical protein
MGITKETILENINEPELLEDLYQSNKRAFSGIIKSLYEEEPGLAIKYWHTRLFYKPLIKKNNAARYAFTALLIVFTWIPLRLASEELYGKNNFLIKAVPAVFSIALSLFFSFGADGSKKVKSTALSIFINGAVYIYFICLPDNSQSQSLNNAFYFMFVLLWFFILFAQSNYHIKGIKNLNYGGFLETTGETIVWSTLFMIGGAAIVILSLALFKAINIDAGKFYEKNIVTLGLAAAPFVSLLVIETVSRIKLSLIIANIFLPLILVSLAAFGILSIFTETKPYEDRDIFIVYNVMMVLVICVLIFTSINGINNRIINICSYILPAVTIILDLITISAVIYRLNKYGITANKITLLGTNIVMLGHLAYMGYLRIKRKTELSITYLPVYFIWALCVVFVFPFVFRMA